LSPSMATSTSDWRPPFKVSLSFTPVAPPTILRVEKVIPPTAVHGVVPRGLEEVVIVVVTRDDLRKGRGRAYRHQQRHQYYHDRYALHLLPTPFSALSSLPSLMTIAFI
jgi:hypothetical protein